MSYPTDLNDRAHAIFEWAKRKGFWDNTTDGMLRNPKDPQGVLRVLAKLALVHSEVSEAVEEVRKGDHDALREELADIIIRVLDLAGALGFNIEQAVASKAVKNEERPHQHGKLA